ncbi:MAG: META domain-containing protein [Silicimonas sp.]
MKRAAFFAASLTLLSCASAAAGELSGTATYRERIAMPPDAVFQAVLFDIVSDAVEIGRMTLSGADGPPYVFTIPYDDAAIRPDGRYTIEVSVTWQGTKTFTAEAETDLGAGDTVDLVMTRSERDSVQMPLPAHGLDLPASFAGTFATNGLTTDWQLGLWPDQSFQLRRVFKGSDGNETSRDSLGRWAVDPTRGALVLRDGAEMPLFLDIKGPDRLGQLGLDGAPVPGDAEELTAGPLEPVDLGGMFLGGEMTYMADAALFQECLSGQLFPISMEGEYAALESAYLADRSAPGERLYVLVEGGIAMRPAMEGADRQALVVDRFIRTLPGESCERQRAEAGLTNTYWRIDELMGETLPMLSGRREPHILLREGDEGGLSATVGCNLMRGRFDAGDGTISFGPIASTMMACPPPLDQVERSLGTALGAAAGYAIEGETLVLKDISGVPVAILTAVYF